MWRARSCVFAKGWVVLASLCISLTAAGAKELANVNGRTITDKDLEISLGGLNEGQRESFLKDQNSRQVLLRSLVDQEVLAQEGEKLRLENEPAFKDTLAQFRKQLLVRTLLEKKIALQMTPSAVKKYFANHRDQFNTDRIHLQQIVLADEAEAKRILVMAKDPSSDFQNLAERFSRDPNAKSSRGELGVLTRDRLPLEISSMVFPAKVGDVVGPIHTAFGYYLFKVVDKKVGKSFDFQDVEFQVQAALRQQLVRNYTDGVKKQSKITIAGAAAR